jgi:WD40 repeat protein/predicted Ser/Thr protein kinase
LEAASPHDSTPPLARNPRRFGDYELLEEIARGGMGVVYRARQISLNRIVAVKVLLFGRFASDAFVKRFRAEAEAAASLQHPNIVAVHDVGEHEGQHYFSMELVEGRNLAELVHDKPLPPRQAAGLLKTIAEAVEYAHRRGVLHRDLKPSNVLIDAAGQPRVTDFGLAKRFNVGQASRLPSAPAPSGGADIGWAKAHAGAGGTPALLSGDELTLTGQVLGSPNFMPPEQADPTRGPLSAAGDVYGLGAILYCLVSGRPPFLAETFEGTMLQVLRHEPLSPRLLNPGVPADLETICLKCLAKEPAKRYASAQALADELGRFLRDEPILARPIGPAGRWARWARRNPALTTLWAGLTVVLVAGIAGIGWQWRRAEANAIEAQREAQRARAAEGAATEQLWLASLEQARAERRSNEAGQRHRALEAISRAAAIRPSLELRNEAIAALTLPDLRFTPVWTNPVATLTAAFTPSLTRFAVSAADKRIRLFRTSEAGEEDAIPALDGWAMQLLFSPDDRFLAVQYSVGSNLVWDVATRTAVLGWGPSSRLGRFTPDSRRLLIPAGSGVIRCVSLPAGSELWSRRSRPNPWGPAIQPQQQVFACYFQNDPNVVVGDLDSGESVRTLTHSSPVSALTWTPDGQRLLVGLENGWIYTWDIGSDNAPEGWRAHDDAVVALAIAPTGQWLATGAWDHTVRIWAWPARNLAVTAHGYVVTDLRFDSDGGRLAGAKRGPLLGLFDLSSSDGFRRFQVPLGDRRGAWSLDVSPDGMRVAASYADGVRLFDFPTGREIAFHPLGECRSVIFMPDGTGLLTCGPAGLERRSFEPGTSTTEPRLGERGAIRDSAGLLYASMTANGQWVAAADHGQDRIVVHEVQNPVNRFSLGKHVDVQHVAFSPDGRWIASGTWNGRGIKIWDVSSRRLVKDIPTGRATAIFSPDSRWLVTGSDRFQIWEAGTWREVHRTQKAPEFVGHAAFSPDSRILATVRNGRAVQLLEPTTGRVLADLEAPGMPPISWLRFTPDGGTLLALEWTRAIQAWDLRRLRAELAARNLDWNEPLQP